MVEGVIANLVFDIFTIFLHLGMFWIGGEWKLGQFRLRQNLLFLFLSRNGSLSFEGGAIWSSAKESP